MNVGDIVRIVAQPSHQTAYLVDEVGFIEEIIGNLAQVTTLTLDGRMGGCGSVGLHCLAPETSGRWRGAKVKYDLYMENLRLQYEAYDKRWKVKLQEVADKFGVTVEKASAIFRELRDWGDR